MDSTKVSGAKLDVQALVVNFNAPELNQLALSLARLDQLVGYVRPYLNKGRWWERALERMPLAGRFYSNTFGRRRIDDLRLIALTREAGVFSDVCATALGRLHFLPGHLRHRWMNEFQEAVRSSASKAGSDLSEEANCVIAYQGFALDTFSNQGRSFQGKTVLNYPIAHHREHRKVREEECALEPEFASTWLGFENWPRGYEQQLDEEIALADGILLGSSYARDSFIAEGVSPQKLKVVSYGVDFHTFWPLTEPVASATFNVVYAGQLTQRKGMSYLLRGYQKFRRPDSRLTLVGALVDGFTPFQPFAHLFTHLPHLTRPELADIYRQSHVFVFPTLLEGMGLVVLEAMACGIPVIVTAHGPSDLVRDGIDGYIVPVRDEDAICDRLERLYNDPERRMEMGRQARKRALHFGWENYSESVSGYLSDLINSSLDYPLDSFVE